MTITDVINRTSAAMLRRLDPEIAHDLAILAMSTGLVPTAPPIRDPRLQVDLLGLSFPNPLGLAAGFDKHAQAVDGLLALGFGFVEIGTVTPLAQPGNPKPRLFRLPEQQAVINRFGFNSHGHDRVAARLARRKGRPGIVGVNIGANKTSADRLADFVAGIRRFAPLADFLAANVSSPNTPGLRDLQARDALDDLLARLAEARDSAAMDLGRRVPVLLKIAPDLSEAGLDDVVSLCLSRGIDGMIVSNTTVSRPGVAGPAAAEAGGLSGRPLFDLSTTILAKTRARVGPDMPLIGVGGVATAEQVVEKIAAGADLVQIYTSFIFADGSLVPTLIEGVVRHLQQEGVPSVRAIRDSRLKDWSVRPLPG